MIADPTGPWFDGELFLFTNDIEPVPNQLPADFDAPTWTGYAKPTVAWFPAAPSSTNAAELVSNLEMFAMGAGAAGSVYGWGLENTANTEVFFAKRFANPIPAGVGQTIFLSARVLLES